MIDCQYCAVETPLHNILAVSNLAFVAEPLLEESLYLYIAYSKIPKKLAGQKYLLLFILIVFSCGRKQSENIQTSSNTNMGKPTIEIIGINLSEDASRLSSNNDELLVLIYEDENTSIFSAPLSMTYAILDAKKREVKIEIDHSLFGKDIVFALIEVDTEKDIVDITSIVTQNVSALLKAHKNQNRIKEIEILGDDDLLEIKEISEQKLSTDYTFIIRGVHKIDRFEYHVNIFVK